MNLTFLHERDHTSIENDEDKNMYPQAQITTISREHREADVFGTSAQKLVPTNVRMSSQYKVCS